MKANFFELEYNPKIDYLITKNLLLGWPKNHNEFDLRKVYKNKYKRLDKSLKKIKKIRDFLRKKKIISFDKEDYQKLIKIITNKSYEYHFTWNMCNMTNNSKHSFTYDPVIKDKLVKVDNKDINYDLANPGNISRYGNIMYKYQGRRLVEYTNMNNSYNTLKVEYEYNDKGLRTKKIASTIKESNNITKAEYNYEYDGDKLVYEKTPTCTNYYLYDENDEIYGFIQNGTNKYYYVKDSLNNILGIVDDNGSLVVKYELDAYGNHIRVIGNIYNPIRYKGYYYDEESNMYYCQSRYYIPELYRWLNIDNANFLEVDDINKLNLFVYCSNNPVMGIDNDGHFSFLKCLAVGAAIVGEALCVAVVTVATGGTALPVLVGAAVGAGVRGTVSAGNQLLTTGKVDFEQLFTDMAIGAVSGAFGGSTLGVLGMAVSESGTGFLGSIANDFVMGESINFGAAVMAGTSGLIFGLIGGAGAQHDKVATVTKFRGRLKTIKKKGINLKLYLYHLMDMLPIYQTLLHL